MHKGRTVRNGAFKGWCYFVYTKHITTPQGTVPPSSYLEAGLLGPWVWGCGQAEETLPSWLELALDMQQLFRGRAWLASVRQHCRQGYRIQSGEPTKFAICSLSALSTCSIFHSSVPFKLWCFRILVKTSGHFPNISGIWAFHTGA